MLVFSPACVPEARQGFQRGFQKGSKIDTEAAKIGPKSVCTASGPTVSLQVGFGTPLGVAFQWILVAIWNGFVQTIGVELDFCGVFRASPNVPSKSGFL